MVLSLFDSLFFCFFLSVPVFHWLLSFLSLLVLKRIYGFAWFVCYALASLPSLCGAVFFFFFSVFDIVLLVAF